MSRLAQLEAALVKADAAGATDDARALAAAIRQERAGTAAAAPKPAPAPAQRSTMDEVGRQVGLAARYGAEGLADTVGMLTDPIAAGMNALLPGDPIGRIGDAARQGADAIGLPQPENALERVVGDASRAVAGGGGTARAASAASRTVAGPVAGALESMAANPALIAASSAAGGGASGGAREAGAGPGGQVVAGILAAMAPGAVPGAVRGLVRGGEQGQNAMLDAINTFGQAGTSPTVGQATGRRWIQGAEQLLGRTPGASGVIARKAEGQTAAISKTVEEIAASLAPTSSAQQAGRAIERGIVGPGGFMAQFRAKSGELYDTVGKLLPQDAAVPASATNRTLAQLSTPIQGAENASSAMLNSRVATIAKAFQDDLAANGGAMPYESLKQLRTQVGELIGDSALSPDTPTRQLRALYGAMSDDLTAAAKATGDPRVSRAVDRANGYYKAGMARLEEVERVLDRSGGPERVFAAVTSGTREGATTLRTVMQSLPRDAQRQVAATVLRRLGRANASAQDDLGEAFSTETFLSNWNKLSPEARGALFDRFGTRYVQDMDAIAKLPAVAKSASTLRESGEVFANPSRSSDGAIQAGTIGGLVLSAATGNMPAVSGIAGTMVTGNAAARALTSPKVVSWLAQNSAKPVAALPSQLAALKAQAYAAGDEEALEFVRSFEE